MCRGAGLSVEIILLRCERLMSPPPLLFLINLVAIYNYKFTAAAAVCIEWVTVSLCEALGITL